MNSISAHMADDVLNLLKLERKPAAPDYLDEILYAYTRTVPWESASRIVRRINLQNNYEACPRFPTEFWELALAHGTGGTCFETNLALYSLLTALGFDGYLTINNMGANLGCHTAIVVQLNGDKWLFDAGYPLECIVPLHESEKTMKRAKFLTYHAIPTENNTYQILRSRHPIPYIFTLYDTPVEIETYKKATANDYRPEGNFNSRIVINKIVDEKMVRFSTQPDEGMFEAFTADPNKGMAQRETFSVDENLVSNLSTQFHMPTQLLENALNSIQPADQAS